MAWIGVILLGLGVFVYLIMNTLMAQVVPLLVVQNDLLRQQQVALEAIRKKLDG